MLEPSNAAGRVEADELRDITDSAESIYWPGDLDEIMASKHRSSEAPLEIEDESDSEDSKHAGNGVPCKFYNTTGCRRGRACKFAHRPDSKSVRDELCVLPDFAREHSSDLKR